HSRLLPGTFAFAAPQVISACGFWVEVVYANFWPVPYVYQSGDARTYRFSCTLPSRSCICPVPQKSFLAGNSAILDWKKYITSAAN
ncbi:MAG: hypothetical protein Q6J18_02755, partial [Gloeomargarita sp. DG02_3_bins_56]